MFTIQFASNGVSKTQTFDSTNRTKLAHHLMQFPQPIINVYEQATPINNAIRKEMQRWGGVMTLSEWGRKFMDDGVAHLSFPA